jgi:hypothetical protein
LKQVHPICELHLSFDGIALMHHADGAWSRVHNIDLDPDTLERDMADLRNHVQSLSHEQAAVNLVLPQDQIKFLVLDHDLDQADDQITKVIAHELEQNTPYLISELRYDYKILDNKVHVAAVALETLQEVEEFVTTHGFDVIGSRAAEQMGGFENGAYFGRASDHAGRSVRPAIADIPNTTITPSPTQSPAVPPAAEQTTAPAPQPAPAPVAGSVTDTAKKTAPASANLVAAPMPTKPTPVINAAAAPSVPSKSEAAATIVAQKLAAISVERAAKTPPSARATPAKEKQTYIALAVGLAVILLLGLGWWMAGPADTPDTDTAQTETIPTDATQIDANQPERIEQISLSDPAATPDTDLGATADPAVPSDVTGDTLGVQTPPQTPAGTTEQTNTVTYSDQDVQRIYAATGIWVRGPDSEPAKWPEPLGDIYIASIDRVIELQDAVALPSPQSYQTDTGIRTPAVPAPAGTIFELNALGLIQATAQGALAPEGYTVFLGRPSVTPPENPQADIEPVLNDARSILTTNGTPLIDLRPRPRPALSVLEAPAQQQTDALALLRPKTRPDTISALSEAMATPAPDTGLTAVPTPKIRPNALQTTVLSPEEAEGDEAAVTSAAPRIPSNAKVAEEATIQNALKLNDLNLIGVYGSGSSKRALVRFANGKRQMVSVGDRLDGGKVAAIGDTELRYVKGGRNVVLKLPRG